MSQNEEAPRNGAEPQDQPKPDQRPALMMDDQQAHQLSAFLAAALQSLRLFEGAVVEDRVSMRAVRGPLAATLAVQLVQLMRGQDIRQYNVRKTLRDLFRGIPMPPKLEESLLALHPNSDAFGTEFSVNDDDGTMAAKVSFKVEMVPTIALPKGMRSLKQ